MTAAIGLSLTLLIMCTLGLVWSETKDRQTLQFMFKPLASLSFCALAIASGALGSFYGHLILLALIFSLIGDVMLLRKGTGALFKTGMLAFLLAHLIYAHAFFYIAPSHSAFGVAIAIGVIAGVANAVIYSRYISRNLSILTGFYAAIIGVMLVLGLYAGLKTGLWIIALAAQMFVASDILVARERYVKSSPFNFALLTPLYFGAQGLFALSILSVASLA